ncbi:MAG: M20/M25/M40 family metallo-hydrolase, partial [Planctomycetota bacterium]
MTSVESAIAAFNEQKDQFLADLMTFLRFETVSTQPEHTDDLRRCADWVHDQLTSAGLEAKVIPTEKHPAVFADSGPAESKQQAPTLLFYGHYDVQPIGDPDLWTSPAFEPTIRDGAIYARGSADNTGQLMTHLAAMRCWRQAVGKLPVRVKFLIEGEEEIGSPSLSKFIKDNKDLLACDYVVLSDASKLNADTPAIVVSTRGVIFKQITIYGPSHDLHSGLYGGAVANPANVLTKIIASLHDQQHRVTIPGFYDDVIEFSNEQRKDLLAQSPNDANFLAETGSPATTGEAGFTNIERRTIRPTLDVNGLVGGYTGEGSATIIPAKASAKISMRMVPNQDP